MSKHTPGPWTAYGTTVRAKSRFICGIKHYEIPADEEPPDRSEEADARLIAAAPELLEACRDLQIRVKDLFNRHERHRYSAGSNPDDDLNLLLVAARSAIQKAEGDE